MTLTFVAVTKPTFLCYTTCFIIIPHFLQETHYLYSHFVTLTLVAVTHTYNSNLHLYIIYLHTNFLFDISFLTFSLFRSFVTLTFGQSDKYKPNLSLHMFCNTSSFFLISHSYLKLQFGNRNRVTSNKISSSAFI